MLGSFTKTVKTIWSGDQQPAKPVEPPKEEAKKEGSGPLDSLLSRSIAPDQKDEETLREEAELKEVETRIFMKEQGMDLEDYRTQLSKSTKVASKAKLLKYIPGTSQYTEALSMMEKEMEATKKELALLDAMTPEERKNPTLLFEHGFKRKQRIAATAGQSVAELNKSLERYTFMKELLLIVSRFKKEGKPFPEDPKDFAKWAKEHPEVMKKLKKVAPAGMMNAAAQMKAASRLNR